MERESPVLIGEVATAAAAHVVVLIAMIVFFHVRVPHYLDVYDDVGAELPVMTRMVLNMGSFVVNHVVWFVPPLILLLAADVCIYAVIRKNKTEALARAWAWGVLAILGLFLVGCWLSVRLPLFQLTKGAPMS